MILKRIRYSLTNDDGASVPMILALILLVMVVFAALFQYFYTITILNTIRESCFSISESALIANAESSYQAKRDGYTGVWYLDGGEPTDPTVIIDVKENLANQLNLISIEDELVKTDGGREIYRINNIQFTIENPGFQKDNVPLTAIISLNVDMILRFPLIDSYPVSIPIQVSAAWNRKF